jgi:hypothetical protein
MKIRRPVLAVFLAILIVASISALIPSPAQAQCGQPGTPACPPGEKKTKRPTPAPPTTTSTPTATHTPTANATITPSATPSKTPIATTTPYQLCLSPEEMKICLGNPGCQPLPPLCPPTAGPTRTPTPFLIPLSPFPPETNMVLGIVLLGGGLFAGVWLLARRGPKAPGRDDSDGLSDTWETNQGIDMNSDGHIDSSNDVNLNQDPSDPSSPMRKPPDEA